MGCRVCRARKVKCDGRPNGCRNCERLQLDCVADDGSTPSGKRSSSASLKKIRTYRSCTSCRLSKTKCDGERPFCRRCVTKRLECVYDGSSEPRWAKNVEHQPTLVHPGPSSGGPQSPSSSANGSISDVQSSIPDDLVRPPNAMTTAMQGLPPHGPGNPLLPGLTAKASNLPAMVPSDVTSNSYAWLLSPDLPTSRNLRRLVDQYFTNIHPLRCFAFVHKPTFMRQLDKGVQSEDEATLLHVICAHGAKFHVLSLHDNDMLSDLTLIKAAGNQWAKKAEFMMMTNFGRISIQRLMAAILLHDFNFRNGEYSQALMLSGLAVRIAQALKINTEYSPDVLCTDTAAGAPSVVSRECRRRLMWACYVLDAWTGSGVDHLTMLRENDIMIQLPCNERNFGLRIPCVTETLGVGHVLQFLPPAIVPRRPVTNMGIMAYYVRIVTLWKRVVRYATRVDSSPPPWTPESEFSSIDTDLRSWRRELPDFVEYSPDTIYARLDSNQLGGLVLIHCTYHHNFLELYKLSMPDLFKLRNPVHFPPEQQDFLQSIQADCFHHAHETAKILGEVSEHGAHCLSDALLPFFVYDSSRVLLYYTARLLDPKRADAQSKINEAIHAVESNNRVLRLITPLFSIAGSLSSTIERWLEKIKGSANNPGQLDRVLPSDRTDVQDLEAHTSASASQGTQDYVLPPLSLHRLTRAGPDDARLPQRLTDSSWSTENPNAASGTTWDHNIAAQQLVGLSQDATISSSLQHERPVSSNPQPIYESAQRPFGDSLDLDDLQNFLSWDVYDIMDVQDDTSPFSGEDDGIHSWSGAI